MTAFDAAIDTLFGDPNHALDGSYTPSGGSAGDVRIILGSWDATGDAAGVTVRQAGKRGQVRQSEVAVAAKGDTVTVAGTTYQVQSARLDEAGVWQLGLRTT